MNEIVSLRGASRFGGSDRWEYPSPVQPSSSPDGEGAPVDLSRLLTALRRYWWIILLFGIAAGVASSYLTRNQTRVYSARAVVQLVDGREQLAGSLINSGNSIPVAYQTLSQIEILKSRAVASAVVDSEPLGLRVTSLGFPLTFLRDVTLDPATPAQKIKLDFRPGGVARAGGGELIPYGVPITAGGLRFAVIARPPGATDAAIVVRSHEAAVGRILMGLDATPRKQTNLIDIGFTSDNPSTAERVVNRVAKVFQDVNIRMAQQQLHRRRVFIEEQMTRNDAQLAEADRALSTFRNRQQAYSSQERFRSKQDALSSLDVRREELDGERRMARSLLQNFQTGNASERKTALSMLASAPEISGDRSPVPDLYRKLVDYQRTKAELTSGPAGKAPTHPDVQRLDTLMATMQTEMIAAAQAHIALLDARIDALDEVRNKGASALSQLPATEAAETRLQQNAEALRMQGSSLRTEYQQARIAEAAEVGQVEILDLAAGAASSQPSGVRFIAFAVLLGILFGAAIAVLLESTDRTVKRRDDVEASLFVPVLGTIPKIDGEELRRGRFPVLTSVANSGRTESNRRRGVALTSVTSARSPGAEAFRHLGTSLLYSRQGESARRILVTSPTEGDGKTSVASNLAITLAHQKRRVLLIDCDVYGKLHNIFQFPVSPGLSEVVLNEAHPKEVIHATAIPGLSVITSGRIPERIGDVVGSQRMRALLSDMTQEFDLVVLDCSPVLALADSAILSVNSDAVLLVVRAGYTATSAAVEAMRHLSTVGARVVGVVLNDPEERARQYGNYYYGYSYAGA